MQRSMLPRTSGLRTSILSLPTEILVRILSLSLEDDNPVDLPREDVDKSRKLRLVNKVFNSLVLDAILGDSAGLHKLYLNRHLHTLSESALTLLLRMKEQKPGYHSTAISLIRRVKCTVTNLLLSEYGSILRHSDEEGIEADNERIVDMYTDAFINAMIAYMGPHLTLEHLVIGDMPGEIAFRGAQLQNYGYVALAAVWLGKEEILKTLLDDEKVKETSEFFLIALQVNASGGHIRMFQFLVKRGNPSLKAAGGEQGRMLWIAASKGNIDVLRLFLEAGVDVDSLNGSLGTALHAAATEVDNCVAQLLLQSGADPNFHGEWGRTPLRIVAARSNLPRKAEKSLDFMKTLLRYGADVNDSTDRQPAALYFAAKKGNIAAVNLLLEAGANPNPIPGFFHHPLFGGIKSGDIAIVRLLLDYGSDIDHPRSLNYGQVLIRNAVRSGNKSIFHLLVERNAGPNYVSDQAEPLLEEAILGACPNMIKELIRLGVNVHEHERVVVNLVDWGIDIECAHLLYRKGLSIASPLLKVAVIEGHSHLVKILLEDLSLDPASPNDRETLESLLSDAFKHGQESSASLLVDAGANLRSVSLLELNFSNGVRWQLKLLKAMEERNPMSRDIFAICSPHYDCSGVVIFHTAMAAREMGKVDQAWNYAYAKGADAVELMQFSFDNLSKVKVDQSMQDEPLIQAIHYGDLALVELLMPWYIQKGIRIWQHKALKKALRGGSQIMVKYILDSFQSRYDRQIDDHFHEWRRWLEEELCYALEFHFPTAQQLERYWLEWTSPRHSGGNRFYAENPARLLMAVLDSESEIPLRFILNGDLIKRDVLFTPETAGSEGLFEAEIIATAIVTGNMFVLKKYVAAGVDLSTRVTGGPLLYDNFDWSPIREDLRFTRDWTPLSLASYTGQGEVVKYLLAVGTNPKLAHEELSKPVPHRTNRSLLKLVMNTPEPMDS